MAAGVVRADVGFGRVGGVGLDVGLGGGGEGWVSGKEEEEEGREREGRKGEGEKVQFELLLFLDPSTFRDSKLTWRRNSEDE